MTVSKVNSLFSQKFSKQALTVIAPGRINLIGEHTDYNEGFVMPAAVDRQIEFAVATNGTDVFNIFSADFNDSISFTRNELKAGNHWSNYLMGVVDGFIDKGKIIKGVDCVFGGNIPAGAGMSSSAALCSGFGFALNELFKCGLSRMELALIGQRAEHRFAGVRCGIMDQYASLFGEKDSALLLDCRSLKHEVLPLNLGDYELLLVDTKVKHELGTSAYNERRAACEEGVHALQQAQSAIHSLRDVTVEQLQTIQSKVTPSVFAKCSYVINEITRTKRAAQMLKQNNLAGFGNAMYETHWGLSREFEVSCEESDFIASLASTHSEVLGARQMGGGFGGCVIHLIHKAAISKYSLQVKEKYVATFKKEPDFYSVNISQGVHLV